MISVELLMNPITNILYSHVKAVLSLEKKEFLIVITYAGFSCCFFLSFTYYFQIHLLVVLVMNLKKSLFRCPIILCIITFFSAIFSLVSPQFHFALTEHSSG